MASPQAARVCVVLLLGGADAHDVVFVVRGGDYPAPVLCVP